MYLASLSVTYPPACQWFGHVLTNRTRVQIFVHIIIAIVSIGAFVSQTIQCFLGNVCQRSGNFSESDDVIQSRISLSEAFLFNP